MRTHRLPILLISCIPLNPLMLAQPQPLLLGVLEDTPGRYAGEPHHRNVRAVFRQAGGEWQAFPSDCPDADCLQSIASRFPPRVSWTIGFDGRAIGQVTARTPAAFQFYSEIGQQIIDGTSAIPAVGKPSAAYAGWQDEPVYRPLVASSRSNFGDPEGWKPSLPPAAVVRQIRLEFQRKYPRLVDCEDSEKPKLYTGSEVRPAKAYLSNRGWRLVQMAANACAPDDDGSPLGSEWFVVTAAGQISYLDRNMWLVDAGDYDNDGSAEVIFSIAGYNRGGYRIFYAGFRKSAAFEFSFH